MPQSTAKSSALVRDLADKLAKRFPSGAAGLDTVRLAMDANGWSMIVLSHLANEVAGQPAIIIRVKGVDAVSKDIFGNATSSYAPHICEVGYELAAANKPEPSLADLAVAKFEAERMGCRFQEKSFANGTAVSEAALNAASPIADLEDLYWPTKSV